VFVARASQAEAAVSSPQPSPSTPSATSGPAHDGTTIDQDEAHSPINFFGLSGLDSSSDGDDDDDDDDDDVKAARTNEPEQEREQEHQATTLPAQPGTHLRALGLSSAAALPSVDSFWDSIATPGPSMRRASLVAGAQRSHVPLVTGLDLLPQRY